MHDVVIIGAGIAGAACARELSRYDLDILVVEAGYDVACGTTRANSGIVHAGYDPLPGTLKARYNIAGAHLYPHLAEELGFEYRACGSLVVAFADEEVPALNDLLERGRRNGVAGLEIFGSDRLHEREPNISSDAVAALWVPTGAICDPYGACLALAENAATNGVSFSFDTRVEHVKRIEGGYRLFVSRPYAAATIDTRIVIDAAGLDSARLASEVSSDSFVITPRAGEYVLLDTVWGEAFRSTVFQVPSAAGKGVLVTPTTGGNMLIGPNAQARKGSDETQTTGEGLDYILRCASKTWADIPVRDAITNFCGLRASCVESPDFHLGEPDDAPGFFRIVGLDSPGLTAAPAIAVDYARQISQRLDAKPRKGFNARREAPRRFRDMTADERNALIADDPAWGRIVCRCECVSEAEIVHATHSVLPATTTDAVKWRTRAGMGRCQAGFCLPLVAGIIARERGIDVADVRKGPLGSKIAIGHRGCIDGLPHVAFPGEDAGIAPDQTAVGEGAGIAPARASGEGGGRDDA